MYSINVQIHYYIYTHTHIHIYYYYSEALCFLSLQVEYLLKKICMAISIELNCVELEDFFSQDTVQQSGITVWVFLEMMNSGKITKGIDQSVTSMAIEEVYREIVGDVLKEVGRGRSSSPFFHETPVSLSPWLCAGFMQGYLWKKGQLRRNWKERWFTLRPSNLSYYTSEDRKECQGNIALDGNCCVEVSSRKIFPATHFFGFIVFFLKQGDLL